jgi:Aminotransferase class I and II
LVDQAFRTHCGDQCRIIAEEQIADGKPPSVGDPTLCQMVRPVMQHMAALTERAQIGRGDAARARGLWILPDEVYSHFVYGNVAASSFLQSCTDEDRLVVANTFSKNCAMTGWLIYPRGWTACSPG